MNPWLPDDKDFTGCSLCHTGASHRICQLELRSSEANLNVEKKPATCIGKSWLYSQEKCPAEEFNPFLVPKGIMNSPAPKLPMTMFSKKLLLSKVFDD